jgi:hypothetical protein
MRAVDGKHLKLVRAHMAHPARSLPCLPILGALEGIHEVGKPRLPFRELAEAAERNPLIISTPLLDRRYKISNNRHGDGRGNNPV